MLLNHHNPKHHLNRRRRRFHQKTLLVLLFCFLRRYSLVNNNQHGPSGGLDSSSRLRSSLAREPYGAEQGDSTDHFHPWTFWVEEE